MNEPDYIHYEIGEDGTCSYCGEDGELTGTPDGDVVVTGSCYYCDQFNWQLLLEFRSTEVAVGDRSASSAHHRPAGDGDRQSSDGR